MHNSGGNSRGREIVIVSGLPRSGTSMMMRMLEAGGMPLLTDGNRAADEDNPRGYYEFERVKKVREDTMWMAEAAGKAVKVISFLLDALPLEYGYRVVFMRRAMPEILASQRKMLERRGESDKSGDARMGELLEKHLGHIVPWVERQPNIQILFVEHREALEHPRRTAARVSAFVGGGLDEDAMAASVERGLHRQRFD